MLQQPRLYHEYLTRGGLYQLNHPRLLLGVQLFTRSHNPTITNNPPPHIMSSDWTHSYCLTCDKQTDSTTYCSESCRLAEYEQSSNPSTGPSSPAFSGPSYPWAYTKPPTHTNKLYLSPACDFSHAAAAQSSHRRTSLALPQRVLSPSSSHASLCSMKSNSSSSTEAAMQLSDAARKELLAYASSFENARSSRRQSH